LDANTVTGLAFIDGHGYRIGQIGSFIRIPIGFTDLFGIVSQVGAGAVPESLVAAEPYGYRWMRVQLIGEGHRGAEFRRGISQYPTIGDEAHLVTEDDLSRIYGRVDAPNSVRVGSLASAESIAALVDLNRLITRHSAIVGTTGAGKSTTVASLSHPSRPPIRDAHYRPDHGEYHAALRDRATLFRVNPDEAQGEKALFIPYWALSFDELLRVTPFRGVVDADRAAVIEKVKQLKLASLQTQARPGVTADTLTVDAPVPFSIHRLWYDFYRLVCSTHTTPAANQSSATEAFELNGQGQVLLGDAMSVTPPRYRPITQGGPGRVYLSGAPFNIRRQIVALESQLRDTRYDFLFRPGPWCPNPDGVPARDLDELLRLWIGADTPITILDLSGVPVSILLDLVKP
jgi:hypothetical protein